jgi:xanthine dehydrogenase small subunit
MIEFILNDKLISTDNPLGMPLLDFIRGEMELTGTKIGCREGDCGACMVMEGELLGDRMNYKTIVSCLTPLGNVRGKHIVSIEGINGTELSPVQQAIVDHSGTQCGFCTPGFVISLITHSLSDASSDYEKTLASIDGNICRCTGYKSIERAAKSIWKLNLSRAETDPVDWMVRNNYLPSWFVSIPERLAAIKKQDHPLSKNDLIIGGGTDLLVQKADEVLDSGLNLFSERQDLKGISVKNGFCTIGAAVTASGIMQSDLLKSFFPDLEKHFKLIASSPIRNMGTLAGNIANASPIADLTIFFLAMDTFVLLENPAGDQREIPLKEFFTGYKKLQKDTTEYIREIRFTLPGDSDLFNFEKVSKRENLDIATVNSAISLRLKEDRIDKISLSAGGVAPIPLFLDKTCQYLTGKIPDRETLLTANEIMQEEISPISDIRGSSQYKRLLLRQLFFAHFLELFPGKFNLSMLTQDGGANEKH